MKKGINKKIDDNAKIVTQNEKKMQKNGKDIEKNSKTITQIQTTIQKINQQLHKNSQQLHLNHQYIDDLNKKTAALEGKEPTIIQQIVEAPKGPTPQLDIPEQPLSENEKEEETVDSPAEVEE